MWQYKKSIFYRPDIIVQQLLCHGIEESKRNPCPEAEMAQR
jgi:hypothetical protein